MQANRDRGKGADERWGWFTIWLGAALCLALAASGDEVEAQPAAESGFIVDSWDIESGLPGGTVSSILQTRDGYLWIGTFGGLARFDGLTFTPFTKSTCALRNDRIVCLFEDRAGELWIGTEGGGLVRYAGGEFKAFTTADGLSHDVVLALDEDAEGRLWVGTLGGVNWMRDGIIGNARTDRGALPEQTRAFLKTSDGSLWAATVFDLYRIQGDVLTEHPAGIPAGHHGLLSLREDASGRLWVGASTGLLRFTGAEAEEVPLLESQGETEVWDLCMAVDGSVWLGTRHGLFRLRGDEIIRFGTGDGLDHQEVRCVMQDREGNLWVGTNGGGLNRLKPRLVQVLGLRHGLSHSIVMGLHEDSSGRVWTGLNCGGIDLWEGERFRPFRPEEWAANNDCVWPITEDRAGNLWFGTWGGGLGRIREQTLDWYGVDHGLSDSVVLALCADAAGGLWIGTYSGGISYLHEDRFSRFGAREGSFDNYITANIQTRDGTIWAGSNGSGLARFAGETFTRVNVGVDPFFVRALHEDAQGTLWIGTAGNGLCRLRNGRLEQFSTAQGLPSEVISQILEDGHGHLWLGSTRGIFRIEKADCDLAIRRPGHRLSPLVLGKGDGLENTECTGNFHPAGLKTRDGRLWFSTVKGIAVIDPARIRPRRDPVPVVIERVRMDNFEGEIGIARDGRLSRIEIPSDVQRLQIFYTALTYSSPERTRFRYRLEGLDRDWVDSGSERTATYTRLPPGEYRFEVRACPADGVWGGEGALLTVRVIPPFWATWWFIGAVATGACIVLAGVGWFASRRHSQRKLERLEQENALQVERSRISKDIHDDLGASLTEIALQSELSQRHLQNPIALHAHLLKISQRARHAVQAMDEIVWALNPRNDTLDKLIEYICQYVDEYCEMAGLRCWQDVPEILPALPVTADMRHHLFLVIKEALNNVVKHAGASQVWLHASFKLPMLEIRLRDDGCGLNPEAVGRGNGLRNMRKRIEDLAGEFKVEGEAGRGTQISIQVHISPAREARRKHGRDL